MPSLEAKRRVLQECLDLMNERGKKYREDVFVLVAKMIEQLEPEKGITPFDVVLVFTCMKACRLRNILLNDRKLDEDSVKDLINYLAILLAEDRENGRPTEAQKDLFDGVSAEEIKYAAPSGVKKLESLSYRPGDKTRKVGD